MREITDQKNSEYGHFSPSKYHGQNIMQAPKHLVLNHACRLISWPEIQRLDKMLLKQEKSKMQKLVRRELFNKSKILLFFFAWPLASCTFSTSVINEFLEIYCQGENKIGSKILYSYRAAMWKTRATGVWESIITMFAFLRVNLQSGMCRHSLFGWAGYWYVHCWWRW